MSDKNPKAETTEASETEAPDTPETSDTGSAGDRLDAKISDLQQTWSQLQTQLQNKRAELGEQVGGLVDAFQARIDGLRD